MKIVVLIGTIQLLNLNQKKEISDKRFSYDLEQDASS
jgi:hypothetical protein